MKAPRDRFTDIHLISYESRDVGPAGGSIGSASISISLLRVQYAVRYATRIVEKEILQNPLPVFFNYFKIRGCYTRTHVHKRR